MSFITPQELALWLTGGLDFTLLDVRRAAARSAQGGEIAGTQWRDPALWLDWKDGIGHDKPVLLYCAHGHEISQGLTAALQAMGADARHLHGGYSAWLADGQAVQPLPPPPPQ